MSELGLGLGRNSHVPAVRTMTQAAGPVTEMTMLVSGMPKSESKGGTLSNEGNDVGQECLTVHHSARKRARHAYNARKATVNVFIQPRSIALR